MACVELEAPRNQKVGHMFAHICISLLVAPTLLKQATAPCGSTVSDTESWLHPRQIKRHASHSRRVGVEVGRAGVRGAQLACLPASVPTPGLHQGDPWQSWHHICSPLASRPLLSGPPASALAVASGEWPNGGPDVPLLPADGGSGTHKLSISLHSSSFGYAELSGAQERNRT